MSSNEQMPALIELDNNLGPSSRSIQGRIHMSQTIRDESDSESCNRIRRQFLTIYQNHAKELQVETVMRLVKDRDTCLLAGTGYGKTRIAESFAALYSKKSKPIVLTLNPLEALGDNQVSQ